MRLVHVRVRTSPYSDVVPGTEGVLIGEFEEGFVVDLMAMFSDATGKRRIGKRRMWFTADELEGLPSL